jgi:hypothetical protein
VVIHGKQDQGNAAEEEMLEKEGPDSPLLDLSDVAVKEQLIRGAKKRGYVTHNQINALLSSEEVKPEQIEDILVQLISGVPRTGSGEIIRYKLRKLIRVSRQDWRRDRKRRFMARRQHVTGRRNRS